MGKKSKSNGKTHRAKGLRNYGGSRQQPWDKLELGKGAGGRVEGSQVRPRKEFWAGATHRPTQAHTGPDGAFLNQAT
jgi:hypothetical protein